MSKVALAAQQHQSRTIPGFNGQGTINLDEFIKIQPKEFMDATFLMYDSLDLRKIDVEHPDFWNIGIRAETGNNRERVEEFRVSFTQRGFLTTEFPPAIDTDMNILGGRGRIVAAIENGERWIPVAKYSRSDTSEMNTVTNGLIENLYPPSSSSKFADFVAGGVQLIAKGHLKRDRQEIEEWLYTKVKIHRWYDNSVNGMVTKIVDNIISKSASKQSLVLTRDRKGWEKWVESNLGMPKKEYELMSFDNESYAYRLWTKVLQNANARNPFPVKVIVYTKTDTANQARAKLKLFQEHLEVLVNGTYSLFESMHGVAVKQRAPVFEILGACPQVVGKHDIQGGKLIDIENY
jgi:hypothetical protein